MKWIKNYLLSRKQRKLKRSVRAVNLQEAKTALILYAASKDEDEKLVRNFARYLKEEGISCHTLGFYKKQHKNDRRPEDEMTYYYYDSTEVNFWGVPQKEIVQKMLATEYHLLFDLNLEQKFSLQFLSTLSISKFKVGLAAAYQKEICDLTIKLKNNNLEDLIEQMKKYLNMIKN